MKIIILCAGYATRLYPLTKDRPKPLLRVADKPIIEYILDGAKELPDLDGVYIVTNDKFAGHFEKWQQTYTYPYMIEVVNDMTTSNDDRLGAIGDIHYVVKERNIDDDILVIGGDNLYDLDLADFVHFAQDKQSAAIAVYDVKDKELAKKYGLVEVDENKRVIAFQEKPQEPKTTLASLALYYYSTHTLEALLRYITEGNNADQPGHFVAWLAKNEKVYAYSFDGTWFDIGDFKSLENADKQYRQKG